MAHDTTAPDHRDAFTAWARAGYAARGIVYLLVGGLAAVAAFSQSGRTAGSRGALRALLEAPWGDFLLGAIALGLVGYAIWRGIQAIKDTDHHGTDAKGIAIRSGLFISAISHTLLAIFAATLIFSFGRSSGGSPGGTGGGSENFANWLMSQPYGQWLLGAVGVAIIGAGIAHEIKAWKTKFDRYLSMPAQTQHWAYPICRFGLAIRGVVFVIVGAFFVVAAYQVNPNQAGGISAVFNTVRSQAFGTTLLVIVAIGLFAFGVYSLLEAAYRRVNLPA
jgi:hypothetical protein